MNVMYRVRIANILLIAVVLVSSCFAAEAGSSDERAPLDLLEYEITTTSSNVIDVAGDSAKVISECNITGSADWMTDWTPPGRLKQWFPSYRLGTDDDGVATYLNLFGQYNFKEFLDESTDEEKAALEKYFDYIDDKIACDGKANGGDGIISILDWDGFSINKYNRPAVIHLAIKQFVKLGKLYNSVKLTFSINTNFAAEILLNTIRPQLGKFLENFQIYGTQGETWIPQLLHSIPKHLLPVKYGGTNTDIEL